MTQLQKKYIADNAVDETKIRLQNTGSLKARNAGDSGDVPILQVDSLDEIVLETKTKYNIAPVNNEDLVNKGYVLDVLAGLRDPKDACLCATTANIDLATGGALTIDGIGPLPDGQRILVKNQTNAAENGIYIVNTNGAWPRATDADTVEELTEGASTLILEGSQNARKLYVMQFGIGTIDVDPVTFVQAPNPANFLVPVTLLFNISATDVSNGYVDLNHTAEAQSIVVNAVGGPKQILNVDYSLSEVNGVTRITFAGNLAGLLADGDQLDVTYSYATS